MLVNESTSYGLKSSLSVKNEDIIFSDPNKVIHISTNLKSEKGIILICALGVFIDKKASLSAKKVYLCGIKYFVNNGNVVNLAPSSEFIPREIIKKQTTKNVEEIIHNHGPAVEDLFYEIDPQLYLASEGLINYEDQPGNCSIL